MKPYYIMVHWGDKSSAVTGFIAPQARDTKHAIQLIKKLLIARKILTSDTNTGELSKDRVKDFLKVLKRPWRTFYRWNNTRPCVVVQELHLPVLAGFWLVDLASGISLCNIPDNEVVDTP